MKASVILMVFPLLSAVKVNAQPAPLPEPADKIVKEACQLAARENKNVLIMFHASWCIWCHKMDSSLNDPSCKQFFDDNYVIRHLVVDESKDKQNLENPGAVDLRRKYHGDGQGIPFWLVYDKDGKWLADSKMRPDGAGMEADGDNTGCPASEKEVTYFIKILQKTSGLTPKQLESIRIRFRQNEN